MPLNESGEMYLETIYILSKSKSSVHAVDVAEHMNFSKPSVSRAIGLLKSQQHIAVDKDGSITLTNSGKELATKIFERHTVLSDILKALGVDDKIASDDACRIEHCISEQSFEAIKNYFKDKK
ncbi:MAG: metal-dependent transcriptional regulator [Clostridia bacterium]|nr:metal-dependent transcriptional regulator [Clostridia bacterium]